MKIGSTSQGPKSQVTSSKMGEKIGNSEICWSKRASGIAAGGGQERGRRGREKRERTG